MNANDLKSRLAKHRKAPNCTADTAAKISSEHKSDLLLRYLPWFGIPAFQSVFTFSPETSVSNLAIRITVTGDNASHIFLSVRIF
jgi:hypothetical protein